jgi:hypothetical protein
MKIIFSIVFIVFCLLGLRHFYFYSDEVDQGSAYGFDIGMSKDSASRVIRHLDCGENCGVILSKAVSRNNVASVHRSPAENIQLVPHEKMNVWQIRYGGSEKNVLVLQFEENKLKYMLRYRRLWVL